MCGICLYVQHMSSHLVIEINCPVMFTSFSVLSIWTPEIILQFEEIQ